MKFYNILVLALLLTATLSIKCPPGQRKSQIGNWCEDDSDYQFDQEINDPSWNNYQNGIDNIMNSEEFQEYQRQQEQIDLEMQFMQTLGRVITDLKQLFQLYEEQNN